MSINAKSVKSIRKKDLSTQKTPFVAFKSFSFAHEATAGQTVISLTSLSTPSSLSSQGFLQPSASDLAAANLLMYKRNLRLQSSLRGTLIEYDSYRIVGSSTIQLTFEAESGEIFVGVISDIAKSGLQVIDANTLVATGTLAAGQTDFVVGQSFALNQYPLKQVGDVLVFLDGVQQFRNVGNATASVSADGNYQEVDGGQGLSNTIRFNIVDPLNDRSILVVSNGTLAERPEGSMRAEIESLAAQVDSVIETLAVVAGVPESNFQSAPNQVDLQTFGQRVINLESNRARIDQTNTFSVFQNIPGRTDGLAVSAGFPGEHIIAAVTNATTPGTGSGFASVVCRTLTLNKGVYLILSQFNPSGFGGNTGLTVVSIAAGVGSPTLLGCTSSTAYSPGADITRASHTAFCIVNTDNSTVTQSASASTGSTISGTVTLGGALVAVRIA
jgi:hypothetical protein